MTLYNLLLFFDYAVLALLHSRGYIACQKCIISLCFTSFSYTFRDGFQVLSQLQSPAAPLRFVYSSSWSQRGDAVFLSGLPLFLLVFARFVAPSLF